jgi:hypothetical protein
LPGVADGWVHLPDGSDNQGCGPDEAAVLAALRSPTAAAAATAETTEVTAAALAAAFVPAAASAASLRGPTQAPSEATTAVADTFTTMLSSFSGVFETPPLPPPPREVYPPCPSLAAPLVSAAAEVGVAATAGDPESAFGVARGFSFGAFGSFGSFGDGGDSGDGGSYVAPSAADVLRANGGANGAPESLPRSPEEGLRPAQKESPPAGALAYVAAAAEEASRSV